METPNSQQLPRVLGPWMATALVIGTVIGSGVFKKPHAVATQLSEFGLIMIAWVLVGLLAFLGSIVLAEVAVIHPHAGGNYVFLREGYGRWAGFLWGWVEFWIIRSGSIAALASVFTETLHDILRMVKNASPTEEVLSFWQLQGITVAVITILACVNARGTLLGGRLQLVVTTVKVVSLVSIAVSPFIFLAFTSSSAVDPSLLQPIWPADWTAIDWSKFGGAMVAIIWAYHGWMNLAPMAEEVKNPNRNLPLSFLMGTLSVMAIYLSVNVAYHLVVSRQDMVKLGGDSPVATIFSERLLGSVGLLFASLALMTSVFGSLNGNLLVGPRLLFAMGKDGLAPHGLCQLHSRWGTPAVAVMVLAAWSVLLVLCAGLLKFGAPALIGWTQSWRWEIGDWIIGPVVAFKALQEKAIFDMITDFAMFGAVSFETMAVASIFVCRRQYPVDKVPLPYRCWGYPWVPIFYVSVMAAVLVNMFRTQTTEALIGVAFIGVGALIYLFVFARKQTLADSLPSPSGRGAGGEGVG